LVIGVDDLIVIPLGAVPFDKFREIILKGKVAELLREGGELIVEAILISLELVDGNAPDEDGEKETYDGSDDLADVGARLP
jgi:hypothetical protein